MMPLAAIQRAAAHEFGLTVDMMMSNRRHIRVAHPRMIGMWISVELTEHTHTAIAQFYNKDHTTVGYALEKLPGIFEKYPDTGMRARRLREDLERHMPKLGGIEEAMHRRIMQLEKRLMFQVHHDPVGVLAKLEAMLDD